MKKILTGGVGKVEVTGTVKALALDGVDIVVSSDMDAAMKLRAGQADFYLGTCHTGAGASLGVLVGLMGRPRATPSGVPYRPRTRSTPCSTRARRSSASPWTRSTSSLR